MKLQAILGPLLLGSLIACSGAKEDAPADEKQPAAATKPETTDADETKRAGDTTANQNTTTTTDPAPTEPAPTTDPAPVAQTCETLKTAAPAGKLTDVKAVTGFYEITPVDVYATIDDEGLHIILTETANACAYHANALRAAHMNELSLDFPKTDKELGPGSFKPSGFSHETGTVCSPDGDFNAIGTAWGGGSALGKVTLTTKTDTLVEGTVTVTTAAGKNTFTFSAPICAKPAADAELECCAAE